MTTPNDLPSVGTEDALRFATLNEQCANAWKESSEAHKFRMDTGRTIRALVSERDELASRVSELEGALCQISDMTYDSWTNGAIAKQIADAALNASKEHP